MENLKGGHGMIFSFKPVRTNYFGILETTTPDKFVVFLAKVRGKNDMARKVIASTVIKRKDLRDIGEVIMKLTDPNTNE